MNKMKKIRKNKKGFTLVEVVVVLVIIAILIAIAVPSVMKYIDDANEAKYLAEARSVYIATEAEITKDYADNKAVDFSIYKTTTVTSPTVAELNKAVETATGFGINTIVSLKADGAIISSTTKPNEVKKYTFVFKSPSSGDYATVTIDKNGTATLDATSSTAPTK